MSKPDIALIINSFNRLSLLKECLTSLSDWIETSAFNGRLVAVIYDAGSTDGSIEWLKEVETQLPIPTEVILPVQGDDTSFSAGLNAGAAYAEQKYPFLKYLLFYETDNQILSEKPLADAMAQLNERANLAACGFTVHKHSGSPAGIGQPFPSLLNFALGKNLVHRFQLEAIPYKWENSESGTAFSEVDVVYTSPILVRLEAWKASGGLDSRLFPFSDCDVDWAMRLYKMGWRMGIIRTTDVIHDNKEALSSWSKSRAIQNHRGRLRYFRRHKPFGIITIWPVCLLIRHFVELVIAKLTVKEPVRRDQLSNQLLYLFKSCIKNYE